MIAVAVALVASFFLLLFKKIGIVEWLQVHGGDLISELANCDFCLSWWLSLIIAIIAAAIIGDWWIIATAVLATPICRKLQ
jgi:hypothetical protein